MYVEFTERERLDIENRLLREMAARYARLTEKEKRTGKPRGLDNRPVRRIRRAGNAPAANESERVRPGWARISDSETGEEFCERSRQEWPAIC